MIHIKRTAPHVKANLESYAAEFCQGDTTIASLAQKANYPPALFARFVLEHLTTLSKPELTQAMAVLKERYRQSEALTTRLAADTSQAVACDPLCGPRHDVARRMVSVEFEVVLEHQLAAIGKCQRVLSHVFACVPSCYCVVV